MCRQCDETEHTIRWWVCSARRRHYSNDVACALPLAFLRLIVGQTRGAWALRWVTTERRVQSAPTTHGTDLGKSAAGHWLSAGDTAARVRIAAVRGAAHPHARVYHKTNSTSGCADGRPASSIAERQCVGLDYDGRTSSPYRTPDRFRSYQAPPALMARRSGASPAVLQRRPPSLIYRRRATRCRQRRRLTGRKSARHRWGLSARPAPVPPPPPPRFTTMTRTRYFLRLWLMLIAKIKALTRR